MIDLDAIRALKVQEIRERANAVRRRLEDQPNYFSDLGNPPPASLLELLVYDVFNLCSDRDALLAEVERLRGELRDAEHELQQAIDDA